MKRYVLIDRDGTINIDKDYLSDPDQLELIPGSAAALKRLAEAGYGIAIVTNQSGIGRGYFDAARLALVHRRLTEMLAAEGASVDAIFHCPHAPHEDCRCRKPEPGMIEQAVEQLGLDPRQAIVIGDKEADVELGKGVGARAILVRTGYGRATEAKGTRADHVADNLAGAVDFILGQAAG